MILGRVLVDVNWVSITFHATDMIAFNAHNQYVQELFAFDGHKLVQFDIEHDITPLVQTAGIKASCFKRMQTVKSELIRVSSGD